VSRKKRVAILLPLILPNFDGLKIFNGKC